MNSNLIGFLVCMGILFAFVIFAIIKCAYAAGWNASVSHHMNRDRMDPFWTTYV